MARGRERLGNGGNQTRLDNMGEGGQHALGPLPACPAGEQVIEALRGCLRAGAMQVTNRTASPPAGQGCATYAYWRAFPACFRRLFSSMQ
jgi:hypothetical protein